MKKKCITASMIMIAIALLINMLGFHIYAETQTYYEGGSITDYLTAYKSNTTNPNYDMYYYTDTNTRLVFVKNGTSLIPYFVSLSSSGKGYSRQSNVNNWTTTTTSSTYHYLNNSGSTFYCRNGSSNTFANLTIYVSYFEYTGIDATKYNSLQDFAYYYTFGDGAVGEQTTPTYGELEISYQQNIITDGNGALNEDIIRWNAYRDTAGNDLQGKNIEIQAIAGYFQGSSYADLKANNFTDWLNATHPAVTMYKGSIEKSYEVYEWGEVATNFRDINTLGMWFWNIFTSEETWYQYGWRYQARLLDEDLEPLTEWQMIYTGNSWTPSATETFTDDEPLKPDDIETINDINDENGTNVNWYINNTYITNNEYNQTYQQNIIENIYNILQGQPDDEINHKASDAQNIIDNAIDTEDDYMNDLQTQLTDLELNDITTNNGLMKALRWVREVHHETIEETELGGIVLTIMLIGLITYLIGRRNG